jgi:hypothetical protein
MESGRKKLDCKIETIDGEQVRNCESEFEYNSEKKEIVQEIGERERERNEETGTPPHAFIIPAPSVSSSASFHSSIHIHIHPLSALDLYGILSKVKTPIHDSIRELVT